jgi:Tfp pilus assembly protein PilF
MDTVSGRLAWSRLVKALTFAACCLLAGCAAEAMRTPAVDTLFADAEHGTPPAALDADVFAISPAMQAALDSADLRAQRKRLGTEQGLVAALYDGGGLKLEYDAARTRSAAEAFEARRGNCLSLVIMTAAFARALGLDVRYQAVVVDENWRRSGDTVVASGHVNLSLGPRGRTGWPGGEGAITIDFLPGEAVQGYRSYPLDEATILAMFANNRAVEALLQDRLDEAYWWARTAVLRDARFVPAYNTLAVIHQRHGDAALAERSWRLALQREPENVVAMRNLAPLLAREGRQGEADALLARAASIEPYPPYYYYEQGMAALQRQDYAQARRLFAREVARAPDHDEFHFWLAVALLRLGQGQEARTQLALAAQTSTSAEMGQRYTAKLELLRKGARQQFD